MSSCGSAWTRVDSVWRLAVVEVEADAVLLMWLCNILEDVVESKSSSRMRVVAIVVWCDVMMRLIECGGASMPLAERSKL